MTRLPNSWKHARRAAKDGLQHSALLRRLSAHGLGMAASLARAPARRLELLARAFARAEDAPLETRLAARIADEEARISDPGAVWAGLNTANGRYQGALKRSPHVNRGVMLKAPGPGGEKGVMLVTFEYNWMRILRAIPDWTELESAYDIIFSNSWSPTDYAAVREVLLRLKGDMFAQTNNYGDIPRLARLDPRIHGVPTQPSDWVHADCHAPRPHAQRTYDIVMVANWAPFKRHWEFFAALRRLPESWRILLIGQPEAGRTLAHVQALAAEYGVRQHIDWRERLPVQEVYALQTQGRISVVLSRREGSCVAVAEAMLADSPAGLRAGAHVGACDYINDQSGRLLRPGRLAEDILALWQAAPSMQTRRWAAANISAEASSRKLNEFMKAASLRRGLPWTRDLAAHCWRPYPSLVHASARESLTQAAADLQSRFPQVFDGSLITLAPAGAAGA